MIRFLWQIHGIALGPLSHPNPGLGPSSWNNYFFLLAFRCYAFLLIICWSGWQTNIWAVFSFPFPACSWALDTYAKMFVLCAAVMFLCLIDTFFFFCLIVVSWILFLFREFALTSTHQNNFSIRNQLLNTWEEPLCSTKPCLKLMLLEIKHLKSWLTTKNMILCTSRGFFYQSILMHGSKTGRS